MSSSSIEFMRLALVQAALSVAKVYPYPGVGCVLVLDGKVIARAHNGGPGSNVPHAEFQVITEAKKSGYSLEKAVLYTNLEPCCNEGLQPSCVRMIIESGIKEVHLSHLDPYKQVRTQGIRQLEASGEIKVVYGELEEEARWMNKRYFDRFCPSCGHPIIDGYFAEAKA